MSVVVRPFEAADLPAAGRLLAERHARHRRSFPLLSSRYEDPQQAVTEVTNVWESDGASGAVAVVGTDVVGYLLAAPKPSELWGSNMWVEAAGQAVSQPELIRDLYALAAAQWVEQGQTAHYAIVPSDDSALLDAWFRLGFGSQHAHAIRPVPSSPLPKHSGLVVRRAERRDIDILAELDLVLPAHQGLSPVFSAGALPTYEEARAEWEESIDDKEFTNFVAEYDGQVIGSSIGCALDKSSLHTGVSRPDNAGFLGFAAVKPEARGQGAGRALGEAVLEWTATMGYDSVVIDWRVTNLLSSRTWPKLGFEQTFHRLHRLIGF